MFKPNENIVHLLRWLTERYNVFLNKSAGKPFPWTDDEIISSHKFTNVFRFLDYESQFLIRHVIGNDDRSYHDTVFRILLFKIFNYSDTWLYLENELGDITSKTSIDDINGCLNKYVDNGGKVFSSAYMAISSPILNKGVEIMPNSNRHEMYFELIGKDLLSLETSNRLKSTNSLK